MSNTEFLQAFFSVKLFRLCGSIKTSGVGLKKPQSSMSNTEFLIVFSL